jgi:hypothetical protein
MKEDPHPYLTRVARGEAERAVAMHEERHHGTIYGERHRTLFERLLRWLRGR